LSEGIATIEATMNRLGVPATIRGTFQGTAKVFQDSLANQPFLILAARVTIYIVLGVL
jgi:multidrug efflux pump